MQRVQHVQFVDLGLQGKPLEFISFRLQLSFVSKPFCICFLAINRCVSVFMSQCVYLRGSACVDDIQSGSSCVCGSIVCAVLDQWIRTLQWGRAFGPNATCTQHRRIRVFGRSAPRFSKRSHAHMLVPREAGLAGLAVHD